MKTLFSATVAMPPVNNRTEAGTVVNQSRVVKVRTICNGTVTKQETIHVQTQGIILK